MKRYHKLQEFPAHASNVNCLKIGRKSSGVLVTGGDDKKVNVWAIGKSSAILTLTGHQAAVDCVSFDVSEEIVVAGATNGTIKMWDLDQAKVTRTLTGHRSNCLCVDFHPYNACLASGSLDTNIKLWDTRRRLCLSTLKGHTKGVTHVKFSPDGKWIVSGSENGEVKLWNLEAGKLYHDFKKHDNAVTGLDFHPKEYILATCSADKTVRLWDIDQLDTIDILGGECHAVRTAMFHPDGQHLLAALQDGLRVWSWEPALQCDNVPVEWSRIADISIVSSHTRLVGCSYNQNMVGVWYIDLNVVQPWCQNPEGNMPLNAYPGPEFISEEPPPIVLPSQSSLNAPPQIPGVMNPLTQALSPMKQTAQPVKRGISLMKSGGESGAPSVSVTACSAVGRNATDRHSRISDSGVSTQADMQRKPTSLNFSRASDGSIQTSASPSPLMVPRAEPLSSRENLQSTSSRAAPDQSPALVIKRRTASNHVEYTSARDPPTLDPKPISQPSPSVRTTSRTTSSLPARRDLAAAPTTREDDPPPLENIHRRVSASSQPSGTAGSRGVQRSSSGTQRPRASSFPQVEIHVPAGPTPQEVLHAPELPSQSYGMDDPFSAPMPSSRGRTTPRNMSPPLREMMAPRPEALPPSGMNGIFSGHLPASSVLPPTSPSRPLAPTPTVPVSTVPTPSIEEQTLQLLRSSKDSLLPAWQVRLSNLALIKTFLMRGNISGALSALKRNADVCLVAIIMEVLTQNKAAITLDSIVDYVPLLEMLLGSTEEHHYKVGMAMLATILLHFGQYIHDTIAHGSGMRVDLTGEQRREKCMGIRTKLSGLVDRLAAVPRREPDTAHQIDDLMMQLEQL